MASLMVLGAGVTQGCSAPPEVRRDVPLAVEATVDDHRLAHRVWGLEPHDPMPPLDTSTLPAALRPQAAEAEPTQGPAEDEADARPQDQEPGVPSPAAQQPPAQQPGPPQAGEAPPGAGDAAAGAGPPQGHAPAGQEPQEVGPSAQERATLRARFGSTVLIAPDGTVTKQYFVTGEAGDVLLNLLLDPTKPEQERPPPDKAFGPLRLGGAASGQSVLGQMLGDLEVEVFFMANFELPEGVQIAPDPAKAEPVWNGAPPPVLKGAPNNLLLVSAKPDALAAFEGALNLFFANVPQIEIEIKVVEYDISNTLAFGVTTIDSDTPTFRQLGQNKLIGDIVSHFPLVAPSFGGTEFVDRGIITLGGIHDSWELNAQLQALEAEGVADIISSPRLVVRNGGTASVVTRTDFPYPQASISSSGQNVTANIKFRPVGVLLNIRPVIAGTETVILQIFANVSAVTSFADTDPVDTPVIASRQVTTAVHVGNGRTTVIGGLVTHAQVEQTSQTPILGDIPILGWLFRSTTTVTERTTLEFHITPRIIRGAGSYVAE